MTTKISIFGIQNRTSLWFLCITYLLKNKPGLFMLCLFIFCYTGSRLQIVFELWILFL